MRLNAQPQNPYPIISQNFIFVENETNTTQKQGVEICWGQTDGAAFNDPLKINCNRAELLQVKKSC